MCSLAPASRLVSPQQAGLSSAFINHSTSARAGPRKVPGSLKRDQNTFHVQDGEASNLFCSSQTLLSGTIKVVGQQWNRAVKVLADDPQHHGTTNPHQQRASAFKCH